MYLEVVMAEEGVPKNRFRGNIGFLGKLNKSISSFVVIFESKWCASKMTKKINKKNFEYGCPIPPLISMYILVQKKYCDGDVPSFITECRKTSLNR